MAKKMYIGIGGVARKVKKMYIGIGGVAKKVKKGYIGINGIARLFFGSKELVKHTGTSISLTTAKRDGINTSSTTFNGKVLFMGGYITAEGDSGTATTNIDSFNSSLTKTTYTLGAVRGMGAASHNSNYAFYAGGCNSSGTEYATVYTFNTSMSRSTTTALTTACWLLAPAEIGSYAIFAGGYKSDPLNQVNAYNTSASKTVPSTILAQAREQIGGSHVGNYALFGGGWITYNSSYKKVDTYNTSLTHGYTSTDLPTATRYRGNFNSKYAFLYTSTLSYIVYYNASLTQGYIAQDTAYRQPNCGCTVLDDVLIFAGSEEGTKTVQYFDEDLTRNFSTDLSVAREQLFSGTIGNYALFAGGQNGSSIYNTIDIYKIQE